MNKKIRMMLLIVIIAITASTFIFAGNNITSPKGKGTVSGGTGKEDDPFQLVLGEPIIDIYYKREEDLPIFFEFTSGKRMDSCNYILEHNSDKHRIRFKFQANGDAACKVTSEDGLRYVQAGAACYTELSELQEYPEYMGSLQTLYESYEETDTATENNNIQIPYYEIRSKEEFQLSGYKHPFTHEVTLGNGYLLVDNGMVSNVSTYGTAYVFAVSKKDASTAYRYLRQDQIEEKAKVVLTSKNIGASTVYGYFTSPTSIMFSELDLTSDKSFKGYKDKKEHSISGNVRVIYEYYGVNSAINDSEDEKKAGFLEKIVAKILFSLADAISEHVLKVKDPDNDGKASLTFDSLVFNEYTPTRIEFFGKSGDINTKLQKVINAWYRVFRTWTLILYIAGLIFIGIRAVLYAGTPNDKKVKMMLEGWVIGLLMIVGFPILMKIAFWVNDALVDVMRVNSRYSVYAYYTFTDLYEGEYEDGEDSTTDVVTKLRRKKASLEKRVTEIVDDLDTYPERIQALEEQVDTAVEQTRLSQEESIKLLKEVEDIFAERGNSISRDGLPLTIDQLKQEINQYMDEYTRETPANISNKLSEKEQEDQLNEYIKYLNQYIQEKIHLNNIKVFDDETGEEKNTNIDLGIKNYITSVCDVYDWNTWRTIQENEKERLERELVESQNKIQDIDNAIAIMENGTADIMSDMKARAGSSYRLIYVIVWFILLFELLLLLILYYKRMFILALLIIVFPLVTVAYIYEKTTKPDSSILRNWIQEFLLNVFIQSVHAILYVTLVETGYAVYVGANQNWVIYLLATTAMITSESMVRNLLGLTGGTVITLSKYAQTAAKATVAIGVATSAVSNTGKDLKRIDNEYKNSIAKAKKGYERNDKKDSIRKTHAMNKIRANSRLSEEEKNRRLGKLEKKYTSKDNRKLKSRLAAAKRRRWNKRIKGVTRIGVDALAGVGTIAGAFAAGGDPTDFKNAATTASLIVGSGKTTALTDDAKKAIEEREANVKEKTEVANVNTSSETPPRPHESYDDHGPGGGTPPPLTGNGGVQPSLYDLFRQRIPEENVHMTEESQRLKEQKTFVQEEMRERLEEKKEKK